MGPQLFVAPPYPAQRWGGKYYPPPLPYFLYSSKTTADIDAKLSVPYPASIWRFFSKISEKSVEKLLRKCRFSDVMFRYFGSKSGKCLKTSKMYSFGVKRNPKSPKGVKLSVLQNGCLRILIFSFLASKTQNFDFSKIKAHKIQNFGIIKKPNYLL